MSYTIDADVLIGALDRNDAHHEQARRLFTRWHAHQDAVMISVVNLSEVLIAAADDPRRLRLARSAISALGVQLNMPTEAVGVDAARLRAGHPISLADAYMLATSKHLDSTVASFDRKVLRAAKAERLVTLS